MSVWAGDQTNAAEEPLVERITWPYDASMGQNQFTVLYTDVFPFDLGAVTADEGLRARSARDGSEFTLATAVPVERKQGQHPPAGTETSCLISTTGPPNGTFVAYMYSDLDGLRTTE